MRRWKLHAANPRLPAGPKAGTDTSARGAPEKLYVLQREVMIFGNGAAPASAHKPSENGSRKVCTRATGTCLRFEDGYVMPQLRKFVTGNQAGHAGADDHDLLRGGIDRDRAQKALDCARLTPAAAIALRCSGTGVCLFGTPRLPLRIYGTRSRFGVRRLDAALAD